MSVDNDATSGELDKTVSRLEAERNQLRTELQKANSKLTVWKEKTKAGVDQMRQQVIDLSTALDETRAERDDLVERLNKVVAAPVPGPPPEAPQATATDTSGLPAPSDACGANALHLVGDTQDWFFMYESAKIDAFTAFALQTVGASPVASHAAAEDSGSEQLLGASPTLSSDPSPSLVNGDQRCCPATAAAVAASPPPEDYETYKRRVTTTLKLQTKNCETLQRQVEQLKVTVASLTDAVKDRERSLAARNDSVALLEQRLDATDRANRLLEEQRDLMLRGPNMDQINALEDQLEQEVTRVRAEYSARENAIFVQHHDELDRMRAIAEQELAQARREYEERLAVVAEELEQRTTTVANAVCNGHSDVDTATRGSGRDDAAYGKLLTEYEALEVRLNALEDENAVLRRDAAYNRANAMGTTHPPLSPAFTEGNRLDPYRGPLAVGDPATLQEARNAITEQHAMLTSLSEQLWSAKKELLDHQRRRETPVAVPDSLDPQQTTYLRSVLVRALCARRADDVLATLLPVFSTMLNFDSTDLRLIYEAHPSWIAKK